MTIRRSSRISTESGWISVLLGNVNRINLNQLRLKQLIQIEHRLDFRRSLAPGLRSSPFGGARAPVPEQRLLRGGPLDF